jgi:flagellar assembly protein FliH
VEVAEGAPLLGTALAAKEVTPFEFRLLKGDGPAQEGVQEAETVAEDAALREAASRAAIEAGRREGHLAGQLEGRKAERAELESQMQAALLRERQRVTEAVAQFREARERYFQDIEQEVVRLALAIAGRVLHREAQLDPLLLEGVVRVALEKMADRSGVVLRVAAADVSAWEQVFAASHAGEAEPERPNVREDARLERGECRLETRMGTVELGVRVQLEEIEKGFFDLLHRRPAE